MAVNEGKPSLQTVSKLELINENNKKESAKENFMLFMDAVWPTVATYYLQVEREIAATIQTYLTSKSNTVITENSRICQDPKISLTKLKNLDTGVTKSDAFQTLLRLDPLQIEGAAAHAADDPQDKQVAEKLHNEKSTPIIANRLCTYPGILYTDSPEMIPLNLRQAITDAERKLREALTTCFGKMLKSFTSSYPKIRFMINKTYPQIRHTVSCSYPNIQYTINSAYEKVGGTVKSSYPKIRKTVTNAYPKRQTITNCYRKFRNFAMKHNNAQHHLGIYHADSNYHDFLYSSSEKALSYANIEMTSKLSTANGEISQALHLASKKVSIALGTANLDILQSLKNATGRVSKSLVKANSEILEALTSANDDLRKYLATAQAEAIRTLDSVRQDLSKSLLILHPNIWPRTLQAYENLKASLEQSHMELLETLSRASSDVCEQITNNHAKYSEAKANVNYELSLALAKANSQVLQVLIAANSKVGDILEKNCEKINTITSGLKVEGGGMNGIRMDPAVIEDKVWRVVEKGETEVWKIAENACLSIETAVESTDSKLWKIADDADNNLRKTVDALEQKLWNVIRTSEWKLKSCAEKQENSLMESLAQLSETLWNSITWHNRDMLKRFSSRDLANKKEQQQGEKLKTMTENPADDTENQVPGIRSSLQVVIFYNNEYYVDFPDDSGDDNKRIPQKAIEYSSCRNTLVEGIAESPSSSEYEGSFVHLKDPKQNPKQVWDSHLKGVAKDRKGYIVDARVFGISSSVTSGEARLDLAQDMNSANIKSTVIECNDLDLLNEKNGPEKSGPTYTRIPRVAMSESYLDHPNAKTIPVSPTASKQIERSEVEVVGLPQQQHSNKASDHHIHQECTSEACSNSSATTTKVKGIEYTQEVPKSSHNYNIAEEATDYAMVPEGEDSDRNVSATSYTSQSTEIKRTLSISDIVNSDQTISEEEFAYIRHILSSSPSENLPQSHGFDMLQNASVPQTLSQAAVVTTESTNMVREPQSKLLLNTLHQNGSDWDRDVDHNHSYAVKQDRSTLHIEKPNITYDTAKPEPDPLIPRTLSVPSIPQYWFNQQTTKKDENGNIIVEWPEQKQTHNVVAHHVDKINNNSDNMPTMGIDARSFSLKLDLMSIPPVEPTNGVTSEHLPNDPNEELKHNLSTMVSLLAQPQPDNENQTDLIFLKEASAVTEIAEDDSDSEWEKENIFCMESGRWKTELQQLQTCMESYDSIPIVNNLTEATSSDNQVEPLQSKDTKSVVTVKDVESKGSGVSTFHHICPKLSDTPFEFDENDRPPSHSSFDLDLETYESLDSLPQSIGSIKESHFDLAPKASNLSDVKRPHTVTMTVSSSVLLMSPLNPANQCQCQSVSPIDAPISIEQLTESFRQNLSEIRTLLAVASSVSDVDDLLGETEKGNIAGSELPELNSNERKDVDCSSSISKLQVKQLLEDCQSAWDMMTSLYQNSSRSNFQQCLKDQASESEPPAAVLPDTNSVATNNKPDEIKTDYDQTKQSLLPFKFPFSVQPDNRDNFQIFNMNASVISNSNPMLPCALYNLPNPNLNCLFVPNSEGEEMNQNVTDSIFMTIKWDTVTSTTVICPEDTRNSTELPVFTEYPEANDVKDEAVPVDSQSYIEDITEEVEEVSQSEIDSVPINFDKEIEMYFKVKSTTDDKTELQEQQIPKNPDFKIKSTDSTDFETELYLQQQEIPKNPESIEETHHEMNKDEVQGVPEILSNGDRLNSATSSSSISSKCVDRDHEPFSDEDDDFGDLNFPYYNYALDSSESDTSNSLLDPGVAERNQIREKVVNFMELTTILFYEAAKQVEQETWLSEFSQDNAEDSSSHPPSELHIHTKNNHLHRTEIEQIFKSSNYSSIGVGSSDNDHPPAVNETQTEVKKSPLNFTDIPSKHELLGRFIHKNPTEIPGKAKKHHRWSIDVFKKLWPSPQVRRKKLNDFKVRLKNSYYSFFSSCQNNKNKRLGRIRKNTIKFQKTYPLRSIDNSTNLNLAVI